jgi:threonine/homoserine/homoserine lactone efflux protein
MHNTYWIFFVMVVFTVASPGPGVLMTLDNAVACGWRAAMHGVLGLALGAAVMSGLSAAGIGLLVRSSPTLFLLLKYCGGAYLFYLAHKAWRRVPALPGANGADTAAGRAQCASGGRIRLLRGVLLQTSNPKALLFFLSVLPQVAGGAGAAQQQVPLALAIATYCMVLIAIHGLYAGLAASARTWLSQPGSMRTLSRLSALVFCAFGVMMLTPKI